MAAFEQLVMTIAAVAFPFVAMILMWRRMKRVRAKVYGDMDPIPHQQPWEDAIAGDGGLTLGKAHNPNDDLIALGAKEKQATWTLTNQ